MGSSVSLTSLPLQNSSTLFPLLTWLLTSPPSLIVSFFHCSSEALPTHSQICSLNGEKSPSPQFSVSGVTLSLWERKLAHPPLPPLLPPLLLHLGSPLSREPSGLLPRIAVRRGAAGGWKNTLKKMKKRSTIKTLLRLVKHSINSVLILFPCLPSCYMRLARFFFFLVWSILIQRRLHPWVLYLWIQSLPSSGRKSTCSCIRWGKHAPVGLFSFQFPFS